MEVVDALPPWYQNNLEQINLKKEIQETHKKH
jgi:hypothetical protein